MRKENLYAIVAFFIMLSSNTIAQTNHTIDTVKYEYFDLKQRPIRNSFFAEKNMGWRMWLIADDGVMRKKVWVDTVKNK